MPPNLLLIVFDTARADAFEPWGAVAGSTPAVADLASRGTAFPFAVAPSNWTLPSHASMFSGLLPGALGLTSRTRMSLGPGKNTRPLLEERADRVLAEVLRRRGYSTRGVSANPFIAPMNGFATGFDELRGVRGVARRKPGGDLRSRAAWMMEAWRATGDDGAAEAEDIVARWLSEHDGRPFFWFVNLMECHSPYLPPRPYNNLSGLQRLRAARDAHRFLTHASIYRVIVGELDVPDDALERMRQLYASAVRQMDDWVARILDRLAATGMLDDTVVVFTSDHGENLGENHLIGHSMSMDDRLIHVPLVVAGPDRPAAQGIVSLAELPKILAPLLGIEDHPWVEEIRPGGFAASQAAGEFWIPVRNEAMQQWGLPEEAVLRVESPITSVTDGRFKLVRDVEGERAYDLAADRLEEKPLDLGGSMPDVPLNQMRAALDAVEAMAPAELAEPDALGGERPSDEEAAQLEERMRELGYL
jgi:arylsulfatase A-like enzyme